jgi:hypothetical protein
MPQQKPKVDYDALANEVRSTVDYDALANEVKGASAPSPVKPEEKSVGGFLRNVLTSGGNFVSDTVEGAISLATLAGRMAQAQQNPLEAAKLGEDFVGLVKSSPQIAKAAINAVKERYGSGEKALNTIYNDPVGVLSDILTVTPAGATRATAAKFPRAAAVVAKARPSNIMGVAGKTLQSRGIVNAGKELKPAIADLKRLSPVGGASLANKADDLAKFVLENKLKKSDDAADLIHKTEEGVSEALEQEFARRTQAIGARSGPRASKFVDEASITNHPEVKVNGGGPEFQELEPPPPVVPHNRGFMPHVEDRINDLRSSASHQAIPDGDVAAIDAVLAKFKETPIVKQFPDGTIEPIDALSVARGTSKWSTNKAYGELKGAEVEAQKAIEQGLRDYVKDQVPETRDLFKTQSQGLSAKDALEAAELRRARNSGSVEQLLGLLKSGGAAAGAFTAGASLPLTVLVGLGLEANRNITGLRRGHMLFNAGKKADKAANVMGAVPDEIYRAALLAALAGREQKDQ